MSNITLIRMNLMVGQTVGAGHFNNQEVPEQVNAMIERFLSIVTSRVSV
jgi:hypothetical protein